MQNHSKGQGPRQQRLLGLKSPRCREYIEEQNCKRLKRNERQGGVARRRLTVGPEGEDGAGVVGFQSIMETILWGARGCGTWCWSGCGSPTNGEAEQDGRC